MCAGYLWPLFRGCINVVRKCHSCQIYHRKMCAPLVPLDLIIVVGPFTKWSIDFIRCNHHSIGGHGYIILAVDYFTKWAKGWQWNHYSFHIQLCDCSIWRPRAIVTDRGSHYWNFMMIKLTMKLGLHHDSSTPDYPQANGEVEVVNKFFSTML